MQFFVLSLILLAIDFILILFRRDLIKESVIGSIAAIPFAILEMTFIPFYWDPHAVGQFSIGRFNFDLEALFFCIAIGGIASICYEVVFKKSTRKINLQKRIPARRIKQGLVIFVLINILLVLLLRPYYIYIAILSGPIGFGMLLLVRKDLLRNGLVGALLFTVIYISVLLLTAMIFYPGWIELSWNKPHLLLNSYLLGIPIEEYLWAFSTGLLWAPAYEYIANRKETNE